MYFEVRALAEVHHSYGRCELLIALPSLSRVTQSRASCRASICPHKRVLRALCSLRSAALLWFSCRFVVSELIVEFLHSHGLETLIALATSPAASNNTKV